MTPLRDANRVASSLALFLSFFLMGLFVSALGPAVPSLSRDVGIEEVSFGTVFSIRGLGHLLGSWASSLTYVVNVSNTEKSRYKNLRLDIDNKGKEQPTCHELPPTERQQYLRQALNNPMNRLGAATIGLGLFSIAMISAETFWLVSAWSFCQGVCVGAIDAIANAAISDVHGAGAAPWVQGLHFFFSTGAFVAPVAVGQLGYRKVFVAFGLLAIPAGLACCLTDGGEDSDSGWPLRGSGHGILLEESDGTVVSIDVTTTCEDDMDIMEAAERRLSYGSLLCQPGSDRLQEEEQTSVSPATGILPTNKIPAHEQDNQLPKSQGTATVSIICDSTGTQRKEESTVEEHMRLNASRSDGETKAARDVLVNKHVQQSRRQALLPKSREEGNLPPFSVVALLALFLFLLVGTEVGFGAWVAVVVLRDGLSGEASAIRMASLFWGGITVGRLLAVPLAVRLSPSFLLRANLLGALLSSVLLVVAGRVTFAWAVLGAGLLGLFMASTYPLAMSLLPSAGFLLSGKNSSWMVIGGALGEMLVPALIAALLGPDDGGWPAALYSVCAAISVLLVVVYCASCSQLKAAGGQVGSGQQG